MSCPHPHTYCPVESPTFGSRAYRFPGPLDPGLYRLQVDGGEMVGSTLEDSPAPTESLLRCSLVLTADLRIPFPLHSPLLLPFLTPVPGYPVIGYRKTTLSESFGSLYLFPTEVSLGTRKREEEKGNT